MQTAGSKAASSLLKSRATGYVSHELYLWHNPGNLGNLQTFVQPTQHWEHTETKRRLQNLLSVSGLLDTFTQLRPRPATVKEITRVHTSDYVQSVQDMSRDYSKGFHTAGDACTFAPGGFDLAALSAGGAIVATDAVLSGAVRNAYALVRPPGHHAERDTGMGFCVFNNVAIAALHALHEHGLSRVAIVDFDVHHGNGTQHIFEEDDRVLFISLHQDSNYPARSGAVTEVGTGKGTGYTVNVPLPPGSGSGAYRTAFEQVVVPALDAFAPELLLVSAGYDASYMDPLASMMLSSEDYRWMTEQLMAVAARHCEQRMVCLHEGGYSELYVPFCGLAVMEQLSGERTKVNDPFLEEVQGWGYQSLQPHQLAVIDQAAKVVELLRSKTQRKDCAAMGVKAAEVAMVAAAR